MPKAPIGALICIRTLVVSALMTVGQAAFASNLEEQVQICAALAGITQNALQDMEARKIPLEKTQIFQEVGHDPNITRSLRDAVNIRRKGVSINEITDAWAQGCMNALGGNSAPTPRGARPAK